MCSLILNLGTSWPHRGQASLGGGWLLKNEVMGVVEAAAAAALAEIPALTSVFFLFLDKDKLRLSLSLLALSVMMQVEAALLDENVCWIFFVAYSVGA